jgi:hypothetical protein
LPGSASWRAVSTTPPSARRLARTLEENLSRLDLVRTVLGGYLEPSAPETSYPSAEMAVHLEVLEAARQSLGDLRCLAAARAEAGGLLKTEAEMHPEDSDVKARRVRRA